MSSDSIIPVSIRTNPFKSFDPACLPVDCAVPWSPYGLYLKERPSFTLDPHFHAGAYYVQDASAMMVGWMFRQILQKQEAFVRVLDLCAAPGGKTTDLAASLREAFGPSFVLVSNEVIRQRAQTLLDNVAVWGDPNVIVTSSDPSDFASVKSYFDIIVADVPCSGEGMFRKSENARNMWSEDNVNLCAARQRRIVADAWDALAPGGIMIYSTCTLNGQENDGNVKWIASELGGELLDFEMPFDGPRRTECGFLMVPGQVRGEGQYCAAIRKNGVPRPAVNAASDGSVAMFDRSGELYALPDVIASQMPLLAKGAGGKRLKVLNAGVHAFTLKGRDRIPCADLALSNLLDPDDFPSVELPLQDALRFLHKDGFALPDAPMGYVVVTYDSLPLGFMKNLGNRANNLHPSGRRILMNVNEIRDI